MQTEKRTFFGTNKNVTGRTCKAELSLSSRRNSRILLLLNEAFHWIMFVIEFLIRICQRLWRRVELSIR